MGKLEDVLGRVDRGETTANDGDWLREQFALQAIARVAGRDSEPRLSSAAIQGRVLQALEDRGYRDGWNDSQYAARQIVLGMMTLAAMVRRMVLPQVPKRHAFKSLDAVQELGDLIVTMEPDSWKGCGIDLDVLGATYERLLTGVAVPLLAFAELLNIDLVAAVDAWCKKGMLVTETGGNGHGHAA